MTVSSGFFPSKGTHDLPPYPIISHISHGCLVLEEYSPFKTFLVPSPNHVLDALAPAYPSCQVVRPQEPYAYF